MFEYYLQNYIYFFIPILVLAFADPAAAIVGKKWPKGKYSFLGNSKTTTGSTAFVIIAFLSSLISFYWFENTISMQVLVVCLAIAIVAAIGESISIMGFDNLLIPLCCIVTLLMFQI